MCANERPILTIRAIREGAASTSGHVVQQTIARVIHIKTPEHSFGVLRAAQFKDNSCCVRGISGSGSISELPWVLHTPEVPPHSRPWRGRTMS